MLVLNTNIRHIEKLHRANINTSRYVGHGARTALQAAAEGGHFDVLNRTLEAKADVNAQPCKEEGRTALQAAARGGHFDVVNLLLEAKADVNAPPPARVEGQTALQAATNGGHLDVVNRLLKAGAI